ncbi:hypothetical protein NPIL_392701 [Nephila pilipes]|uniref:Uncharacterized protein n=1 Tax=Nephila pilipes TaxID=299642 RepID=A0A8X6QEX4_NEPPI|nr:hypothetical protein NPIL_392701 [Nephila pilipes]
MSSVAECPALVAVGGLFGEDISSICTKSTFHAVGVIVCQSVEVSRFGSHLSFHVSDRCQILNFRCSVRIESLSIVERTSHQPRT